MGRKYKIFDIDYLMNEDLTEIDLHYLLDKSSLLHSLIISEFRHIGDDRSNSEIINEYKKDKKWIDKYSFKSKKSYDEFRNKLLKVFKNIYQIGPNSCNSNADWFMIYYGFQWK